MSTLENNHSLNKEIVRCPRCQSVFVDSDSGECDSCGFQLRYAEIGAPLGERSFYTIKDRYWTGLPLIVQNFPILEWKKSHASIQYQKRLLYRLDQLIEFFLHDQQKDLNAWGLFYLELKDLIVELIYYRTDRDLLWQKIDQTKERPFYQGIAAIALEHKESSPSFLSLFPPTLFNLRWGYILTISALLAMIVSSTFLLHLFNK
ncbi:MAG: hypothetical protein WCG27_02670 [Pseudomonadota bacterium]